MRFGADFNRGIRVDKNFTIQNSDDDDDDDDNK